ncbi:mitochondrial fission [Desmophyllum pertusum]|uniref:Mitochondrial fission n=1 Tax=Desmophyllum pertusum TaxID=174260 RepID=A0A9W9Y9B0_9CNID|nr:mitochondrial fission [Desmophyllum pertusum]
METALEVARIILEYFGWDGDEIEELFNRDRRLIGHRRSIIRRIVREWSRYQNKFFTKRSIVREIGSRLPLKPCRRPYFELSLTSSRQEFGEGIEGKPLSQMLMASLADIGWITEDDDLLSEPITDEEELEVILNEYTSPEKESLETISVCNQPTDAVKENSSNNNEAMQKISALEDELKKLQAQIAMMIVAVPQNQATPSTPVGHPYPLPLHHHLLPHRHPCQHL